MLIGLKTLVIRRAKQINHEALSKKFDLKMLRALGMFFGPFFILFFWVL